MTVLLGFDFFGPPELIIVAIVAVLLYGERLPAVAGSFGKKFLELKKSMQGIRDELQAAASDVTTSVRQSVEKQGPVDREEATAPKFEPPPGAPAPDPEGAPPAAAEPHAVPEGH